MQIFDEIKACGVQDVLFISIDDVSGLEYDTKSILPNVAVKRCIGHRVINSFKYSSRKQYKDFTDDLKGIYGAINLQMARENFEVFKVQWREYPSAINIWDMNLMHVEQLFNYGSAVRQVMYTTNSIAATNSSLIKVTKKSAFQSYDSVYRAFYLRIQELTKKWTKPIHNWSTVVNQLLIHDEFRAILSKYTEY